MVSKWPELQRDFRDTLQRLLENLFNVFNLQVTNFTIKACADENLKKAMKVRKFTSFQTTFTLFGMKRWMKSPKNVEFRIVESTHISVGEKVNLYVLMCVCVCVPNVLKN